MIPNNLSLLMSPRPRKRYDGGGVFFRVIFAVLLVAGIALLFPRSEPQELHKRGLKLKRDEECHLIHKAPDKCAFAKANCEDEEAGIISYLSLYYCHLPSVQPLVFVLLLLWLGMLFSTIGIAASDFFCINISTISTLLGLNENLAGVTFLAFGNGSPDVFSTFAAMNSNSGSLAIGELIGAAGFITAVVAGSMAFIRPFRVAKKSFVRDVGFFIVAASFSIVFLADGSLYLWESAVMVGLYAFYVIFVVVWHWWFTRRRRRRATEDVARRNYITPGSEEVDEADLYRDDPEDRDPRDALHTPSAEDFQLLEGDNLSDDEQENLRVSLLGELNSNMRLNRPRPGERRFTQNPIRPSLLGVLEFHSVLAGLQKSRNIQTFPLHHRRHSFDPLIDVHDENDDAAGSDLQARNLGVSRTASGNRMRAVSAVEPGQLQGNVDINVPTIDLFLPQSPTGTKQPPKLSLETAGTSSSNPLAPPSPVISVSPPPSGLPSRSHSPMPLGSKSPQLLAPPDSGLPGKQRATTSGSLEAPRGSLESSISSSIASPSLSQTAAGGSSGDLSYFPTYTDHSPPRSPSASRSSTIFPPLGHELGAETNRVEKPLTLSWWPNNHLPRPEILLSTLFPTLYSWKEKSIWAKALGVVTAPPVLLLTLTVPVVELEREEEEDNDAPNLSVHGTFSSVESNPRPSRRGGGSLNDLLSPRQQSSNNVHDAYQAIAKANAAHGTSAVIPVVPEPRGRSHDILQGRERFITHSPEAIRPEPAAEDSWNRWLVIVQVFTAPIFAVVIMWMNTSIDNPRALVRPCLISLLVSLITLLAILLFTKHDSPPKWRPLFCFLGFFVSICWISTIAGEVVGVLKFLGVILNVRDAVLGLTVFAIGNSCGDLVSDITIARLGFPLMAFSATLATPLMTLLIGAGGSSLVLILRNGGEGDIWHRSLKLSFDRTLMVSGIGLLVTLVGLLIAVPLRNWRMDRVIGTGLIVLWVVVTSVNLVFEVTRTNHSEM